MNNNKKNNYYKIFTLRNKTFEGFTLIELLVVISIIAILMAVSIFGLQGARESSRDARRKADLELIRSGLELYRSDCNTYPVRTSLPSSLVGDNSSSSCLSTNTYIQEIPEDPISSLRNYSYNSNGIIYELCASLEGDTGETVVCTNSCGETCNYKTVSP